MDSCLFAVLIMFLSRVDLRNGNDCLSLKMVSLIGLRLFIFFAKILPFGGKIHNQISPSFEHYSRFFEFVVSLQKAQ